MTYFIKIQNFCSLKDTVKRMKEQATDWRKYLQITYLTKNQYWQYLRNAQWLDNNKQLSFLKWAIQIPNTHLKRYPTSSFIRKMQIKTTVVCHYTSIKIAEIKKTDHTKCWQGCGSNGTLIHQWWKYKTV